MNKTYVCYEIRNNDGELCMSGSGIFESLEDFFNCMNSRYEYNTRDYHFAYSAGNYFTKDFVNNSEESVINSEEIER